MSHVTLLSLLRRYRKYFRQQGKVSSLQRYGSRCPGAVCEDVLAFEVGRIPEKALFLQLH
jgi:hypothetical protein